jgi:endonuclease YncB( thermonuclease family)
MLYFYKAKLISVTDGDTVKVMVDVGFNTHHEIILRLEGFNAQEVRTKDLVEKAQGFKVKERLESMLNSQEYIYVLTNKQGSFKRWLATIWLDEQQQINVNDAIKTYSDMLRRGGDDKKLNQ